ncbi:hypothetical protein HRR80_002491 [Exophiala dermatitidis]|uniref:Uncharacterized protein n=1 Tax=Exophiala dermatitidis TaxID=5970 RepID=A0AAN6IX61_EXODE|nr:hypothetical protein HRR79_002472 [Exophiala dermatitidis]KAJ4619952.1 hypothetical protein HRR86_006663 [Exophiala dermatitidis]KAJ8993992.1 hypothetical protein HRR80_002491 [Exophiala dermatitidis]
MGRWVTSGIRFETSWRVSRVSPTPLTCLSLRLQHAEVLLGTSRLFRQFSLAGACLLSTSSSLGLCAEFLLLRAAHDVPSNHEACLAWRRAGSLGTAFEANLP